EIGRRDASSACLGLGSPNDERSRDVISVARAFLYGVARRQSLAGLVENQAGKEACLSGTRPDGAIHPVLSEGHLNLVPQSLVNNRLMLARIGITFMGNLAAIDTVLQHQVESSAGQFLTAEGRAVCQ